MRISYQAFQWLCVIGNFAMAYGWYRLAKFLIQGQWARARDYALIHGATLNRYQQWALNLPAEVKPMKEKDATN